MQPDSPQCPFHAAPAAAKVLAPEDWLHLPHHQRMVTQRAVAEDGTPELQLFYGDKEISFDEPELFTFGETLAQQSVFQAREALAWGEPGGWERVAGLLQTLLDEGVLRHATPDEQDERVLGEAGACPSPLPRALTDRPRTWHELPGLMQELTGRPLEIGWLELVVPIFRVAHMSVDAEGRQVGESNAFPAVLRTDVPTRWRTCIYPGSRYQDPKPMNVSALKAMRAHWGPMMAMLLKVREAFLQRCPEARHGWTVGQLERLATAVLALPAWQLMRREGRVDNGRLHPVLSSMFRVTDGLRMTMHDMLFIPFGEPTRKPGTPMTAAEVYAFAERSFAFHSEHGVCAGPKAMVEEFLSVLVDGQLPREGLPATLDPGLLAAVADIEPAIDYAMLGLKAYAAVFSHWPMVMRAYEELHAVAHAWAWVEPTPAVLGAWHWSQEVVRRLRESTHLATEAWRADRDVVYADMYAECERVLSGHPPARPLGALLAPRVVDRDEPAAQVLRAAVERHFGAGADDAQRHFRAEWVACLLQYFTQAQAAVRTACEVQRETNHLLGRAQPERPFQVADVDLYVQLDGRTEGRVPFLLDELRRCFGLEVAIDRDTLALQDTKVAA